jgi:NADH-quinone oxidoreductase subunit N
MSLFQIVLPEIILVAAACVLFLIGFAGPKVNGRTCASIALVAIVLALLASLLPLSDGSLGAKVFSDTYQSLRLSGFGVFVRVVGLGMAIFLTALSWPGGRDASGNTSVHWGRDAGEYFGLLLLSFAGLIMVPMANDVIVLFMAIELASIPTYILVSVSRPLAIAQEAGVKYFFLGALAAAILLMGLGYLYGTTGTTNLHEIGQILAGGNGALTPWQMLAGVLAILGIAFKLAAVPLHAYAADVYEGASTAITAVLGFVPKAVGTIALIKILYALGGNTETWQVPDQIAKLVWILAVLTMSVGNLLALTQRNIKRLFAYSSVAHSGYLLAGLAFMLMGANSDRRAESLASVLFYLIVYGITSTAIFGALMLIPSRKRLEIGDRVYATPATTAETTEDLAGYGRTHPLIGLLLAVGCFSLIGLPLTGGFWGKYYLLVGGLKSYSAVTVGGGWLLWLAIFVILNSGLSAAYYLGVVGTLFNRKPSDDAASSAAPATGTYLSVIASTAIVVILGIVLSATNLLSRSASSAAANVDGTLAVVAEPVAVRE